MTGKITTIRGSFKRDWHLTNAEIARLSTEALLRRSSLLQSLIGSDIETEEMLDEYDRVWEEIEKRRAELQ